MKRTIILILLLFSIQTFSQTLSFLPKGIGLEVGFGYNNLKHHVNSVAPLYNTRNYYRDAFKLTPSIRLSFKKEVFRNIAVVPFFGYSIFGGKSSEIKNGYEDEFNFRALEIGLFSSYSINNFSIAGGVKYNRILKVIGYYKGSYIDPENFNKSWNQQDMSFLFKKWSVDLGGRITYNLKNIILSTEVWFSVTDLSSSELSTFVNVSSKRFLLLIGYRL